MESGRPVRCVECGRRGLVQHWCAVGAAHLLHRYSTVPTLCCNTTLLEVLTRCNTCFWSCYNTRCNTSPQEVLPTLFTPVLGLDAPLALPLTHVSYAEEAAYSSAEIGAGHRCWRVALSSVV